MIHLHVRHVGVGRSGGRLAEGQLRRVLLVVGLSQICVTIDYWALSVALPPIARGLGVTITDLQWAISAYLLAFAAPLIAAGRLGDVFGRRRVLFTGVALFGIASAVCGAAPSLDWLVAARVVQGVGAAMLFPTSMAVLSDAFPPSAATGRSGRSWASPASAPRPVRSSAASSRSTSAGASSSI